MRSGGSAPPVARLTVRSNVADGIEGSKSPEAVRAMLPKTLTTEVRLQNHSEVAE